METTNDTMRIRQIVCDLLSHITTHRVTPTMEAVDRLQAIVELARIQAIGCTYSYCCEYVKAGQDISKLEMCTVAEELTAALNPSLRKK